MDYLTVTAAAIYICNKKYIVFPSAKLQIKEEVEGKFVKNLFFYINPNFCLLLPACMSLNVVKSSL